MKNKQSSPCLRFAFVFCSHVSLGNGNPCGQLHFQALPAPLYELGTLQGKGIFVLKPLLSFEFANNVEIFLLAVSLTEVCFYKH